MAEASRRPVIAIAGPSTCHAAAADLARDTGRELANRGAVLLCGAGEVADAAAAGARAAGGLTIALLPGAEAGAGEAPVGAGIEVALFTGLGEARAALAAGSSEGVIAIGGGFGTLAEIALFLRAKKPVVLLDSWSFEIDDVKPNLPRATTGAEAVALLFAEIARRRRP